MSRVFRYIMLQILTKITLINIFVNNLINSEDIVKTRTRIIPVYLICSTNFSTFIFGI
jgi:hypothetical protein